MWHQWITWLQLVFTCSFDLNQHWTDVAFVVLLISLRMWRTSWKGFHKVTSRSIYDSLQCLAELCSCARALFWRKISLNNCPFLHFSEIKWFREHFEATTYYWHSNTLIRGKYMAANFLIVYNKLADTGFICIKL